jgi:hypothetical protein
MVGAHSRKTVINVWLIVLFFRMKLLGFHGSSSTLAGSNSGRPDKGRGGCGYRHSSMFQAGTCVPVKLIVINFVLLLCTPFSCADFQASSFWHAGQQTRRADSSGRNRPEQQHQ